MTMKPLKILLLAAGTMLCALPAPAADVTSERLTNPDLESHQQKVQVQVQSASIISSITPQEEHHGVP